MVKSWAFEFFPNPHAHGGEESAEIDPKLEQDYWNFYMDLWVSAEALGFDGLLLSEHHFGGGYSPSPNILLPAIAQRTKNIRLGVMGNVLPYHTPWRLLEEFAMLDNLTGGRLEIGTSAGIPAELAMVGMSPAEGRARYEESIEVIDKGLKNGVINHKGKYWKIENLPVVPPFAQKPEPPKWTTVISVESARKAAARGSKIATGFISTDKVKEVFDNYKEAAAQAGLEAGPDQLGLRRQVIIDATSVPSEKAEGYKEAFVDMVAAFDKRVIAPGRKALDSDGAHGYAFGDDEFISGSPKEVAEQINDQCERSGAGHFQVVFAGHQSLEELAMSWKLYGEEVIPLLK
ncbi:LLM class flavin-dependent oxidoreductase [Emcibacter sp.]|uniref:LLM class flavin-dependent oxidoreductase n=1 Tax=Emcibacter sp. TaxID=1979954 RepID=UPI002AA8CE86|nr:LLM class flavin-dependent oxidoreductase [Emcibacter sp.]